MSPGKHASSNTRHSPDGCSTCCAKRAPLGHSPVGKAWGSARACGAQPPSTPRPHVRDNVKSGQRGGRPTTATSGFRRPDLGFDRATHGAPKTLLAGVVQKGPSCFGRRQDSCTSPYSSLLNTREGEVGEGPLGVCVALSALRAAFGGLTTGRLFGGAPGGATAGLFWHAGLF